MVEVKRKNKSALFFCHRQKKHSRSTKPSPNVETVKEVGKGDQKGFIEKEMKEGKSKC
jgi:hypothetical protein